MFIHKWLFQFKYSVTCFLHQTFKRLEGYLITYIKYERIRLSQNAFFLRNFISLYKMNKIVSQRSGII